MAYKLSPAAKWQIEKCTASTFPVTRAIDYPAEIVVFCGAKVGKIIGEGFKQQTVIKYHSRHNRETSSRNCG